MTSQASIRVFSRCAAFIAALVCLFPEIGFAAILPDRIILHAGSDFTRVIENTTLTQWYDFSPDFKYHPQAQREIERADYCPWESEFCNAFLSRQTRVHFTLRMVPTLRMGALEPLLDELAQAVDRPPQNARLRFENGAVSVVQDALPGRHLDTSAASALISEAIKTSLPQNELILDLPLIEEPALLRAESLATLGIHDLLGTGESNFRGSPKNRIYNIKRALEQFDGVIIAPGEEFSFVDHLGMVDGDHGYLPELVIKHNRTEPEFGGGICQVSSTVFRAAVRSGLKITARRNHAYPVRYYRPFGMDATIYIPKPDLRFLNNTPGPIVMLPEIDGFDLKFRFYGTSDGRVTTVDGPHILASNPDGSMRTTFTQIITDATGAVVSNDAFPSNYKSPSLFPHPGEESVYTTKPKGWSVRQWNEYKKTRP